MTTAIGSRSNLAHTARISWAIALRSLVNIVRIPAAFVPIIAMPVFFVIAFSGSFDQLTQLPGFPTDNILSWMVPFATIQGAAFAGFGAGFATVRDITTGFYDRLLLAPGSTAALLIGPAISSGLRAMLSILIVFAFGLALGAAFPGGVVGFAMLVVAAVGTAMVATAWALGVVFRIQSQQAAPLLQVGIFFAMFLSTGQVPLVSQTGWVQQVARVNPVTNVLRLGRQGFLGEVTWAATWPGLVALALVGLVLWTFAARGTRKLVP